VNWSSIFFIALTKPSFTMQLTSGMEVFVHVCRQKADTSSNYCDSIQFSVGTNLLHEFMAVTFSVKLAFFREKHPFLWNPWFSRILMLLLSFMKVFRVLSTAFVRILLFAMHHTSALNSWHLFTALLTYIQSSVLT